MPQLKSLIQSVDFCHGSTQYHSRFDRCYNDPAGWKQLTYQDQDHPKGLTQEHYVALKC